MRVILSGVILASALSSPTIAQDEARDWRMPYRDPKQAIDPPADVYRELRIMYERSQDPGAKAHFNDEGIEICSDPAWTAAYKRLISLRQDQGYLSQLIRLSGSVQTREIAFYGMFYNPDLQLVMQMLNHIPGEPSRRLREAGYRRAAAFVKAQLGKANPGDLEEWNKLRVGPAGKLPPKPGEFVYSFDEVPYFALLQIDNPIDQRQGLWFLTQVMSVRPDFAERYLAAVTPLLYVLLLHDDRGVRENARDFLIELDPKRREAPSIDETDEKIQAWVDAILYDVFPPVRHLGPGLTDLHTGPDLDAIVARGIEVLKDGSLGDPDHGQLKDGAPYRGLRIARLPEPLDKLKLEVGWTITTINGLNVASCEDLLRFFERFHKQRSFMVEYVADGKAHAKQFRHPY